MSEQMREDFEAAMRLQGYKQFARKGDRYQFDDIDALWQGFRLGRESLNFDFTHCVFPCEYVDVVMRSGAKVKP